MELRYLCSQHNRPLNYFCKQKKKLQCCLCMSERNQVMINIPQSTEQITKLISQYQHPKQSMSVLTSLKSLLDKKFKTTNQKVGVLIQNLKQKFKKSPIQAAVQFDKIKVDLSEVMSQERQKQDNLLIKIQKDQKFTENCRKLTQYFNSKQVSLSTIDSGYQPLSQTKYFPDYIQNEIGIKHRMKYKINSIKNTLDEMYQDFQIKIQRSVEFVNKVQQRIINVELDNQKLKLDNKQLNQSVKSIMNKLNQSKTQQRMNERNLQTNLMDKKKSLQQNKTNYVKQSGSYPSETLSVRSEAQTYEQNLKQKSVQIDKLKDKINQQEENIQKMRQQFQLSSIFPNSLIIDSRDQKLKIMKFFQNIGKIPQKGDRIFRMTRQNSKRFYQQCGQINNLIVFVKAKTGKKFGGFTSSGWKMKYSDNYQEGFLFSLDRNQMLTLKPDKKPSKFDKGYGPFFGQSELRIDLDGKGFSTVGRYDLNYESPNRIQRFQKQLQDTWLAGSRQFSVQCYEVYKLEFKR